ncbi:MAG: alkaline phosphatase D family protein [Pseudomonadota bacterium]
MYRRTAAKLLVASGAGFGFAGSGWAQSRFTKDPFTLGVASSVPRPNAVTIWTRLAPEPLTPTGGLDPVDHAVMWELATDDAFGSVIARGGAIARPELAHSVRVTVDGLEPGRHHWYRFVSGDATSPIGRTKTLPPLGGRLDSLRFATASCQHFEQGYFVAFDQMIEDDPDFVVHLGDYIYGVSRGDFRDHLRKEVPTSLEDYRLRHALYKTDPSLQRAHASFPFYTVLDNHDALKNVPLSPEQMAKKRAAYQAWFEHMPMEGGYVVGGASLMTHAGIDFGDLLRLNILDTRQFRDDESLCLEHADPDYGFTIYRPACDAVVEEQRTCLGPSQEAWLAHQMASSEQRWNGLASTVLFSPFAMQHRGDTFRYESSWDYFPTNRRRVLDTMRSTGLTNPVILSADVHSNWAIDVKADPDDPESRTVGTEFLATSIASGWPPPLDEPIRANLANNPHVHHYDGSARGYLLHDVTPTTWACTMRTVDDVRSPAAKAAVQAAFVVEDGIGGVKRA